LRGEGKAATGLVLRVGAGGMTPATERALPRRADFSLAVCPERLPSGCATPLGAPKGCPEDQDP